MTRASLGVVLIALAVLASRAVAEPGTGGKPVPGAKRSAGARPAKADPKPPEHSSAAARTLEDIHIEGEIPVPQVLFITARDQRRFMEFQHRRYLRTSRKVGEDTVLPSRIVVTGARPSPDQENSR